VARLGELLGGPVEAFEVPPAVSGTGAAALRWASAIREGVPPWVRAQYSPELERRAKSLAPDMDAVVLLDDYAGVYASALSPLAPVVADKHNVMGGSIAGADVGGGARSRVRHLLSIRLTRRYESAYIQHLAGLVATSDDEGRRLEQLYGRAPDAVVPSAIDLPPATEEPASNAAVGWLGTHEYDPNVEGLERFVREAWRTLGDRGARLLIAGGSPTRRVRELERVSGVTVLGYVEDLDGFLAGLSAAVVPLWSGAGVKMKTLMFLGAGVPVAATPVALEGIEVESGRHCEVAESPAGLAIAVQALLDDQGRARQMGAAARELVAERYTWTVVGPRFREAVERATGSTTAPVTGAETTP
jgi:glycosyltransferase involved in cell wall biosynthesis